MATTSPRRPVQWPLGGDGPFPPLLAIVGALVMAIGSLSPWTDMVTSNDMDTGSYPVIRGVAGHSGALLQQRPVNDQPPHARQEASTG